MKGVVVNRKIPKDEVSSIKPFINFQLRTNSVFEMSVRVYCGFTFLAIFQLYT